MLIKDIPSDWVEYKLYDYIWQMRANEGDTKICSLISKVCHSSLYDLYDDNRNTSIDKMELNQDELLLAEQLELTKHSNPEIRARFSDILSKYSDRKKCDTLRQEASEAYIKTYSLGNSSEFLVRSVQVRISFNDNYWKTLLDYSYETYPCWLTPIVQILIKHKVSNASEKYINPLILHLENNSRNDINWTTQYLQFLFDIKHIDSSTFNYRTALLYERLGMEGHERQKNNPGTFYMDIHQNFEKAFKHIDKIKTKYPEEYSRIRKEYESAKEGLLMMMSLCGIKTKYIVSKDFINGYIVPHIASIKIDDPLMLILYFASTPNLLINKNPEPYQEGFFEESFGSFVKEDDAGNDVGICDAETNHRLQWHLHIRAHQLCLLWSIIEYKDFIGYEYDDVGIFDMFNKLRPDFVDEDKVSIWARGIIAGLKGNYLDAVYILTPMLESGLRTLTCKLKGETLTKLNKERQIQPSLEKTLSELKPYINEELHFEIYSFLTQGYDVNFRNNLLHGILNPMDAYRYSPYIMYLCLRLYFFPDMFRAMN